MRRVEPDGLASRGGADSTEPCVEIIGREARASFCDSARDPGWELGLESLDDSRELALLSDDLARLVIASSLIFGSCRLGGEGGEKIDLGCMRRRETSCQSSGR